jgi:CheY-like chemotaxis protein
MRLSNFPVLTLGDVAPFTQSRYFIFVRNSSTILLAEDDGMDAQLMLKGFKTEGIPFTVKVVNDGAQLIQYLQGEGNFADRAEYPIPGLILLDMRMPRVDGFGVLKWMQSQRDFCKLPVVAIGASMSAEMVTRAFEYGASCVLSKTHDVHKFAKELKKLIEAYLGPGSSILVR